MAIKVADHFADIKRRLDELSGIVPAPKPPTNEKKQEPEQVVQESGFYFAPPVSAMRDSDGDTILFNDAHPNWGI